MEWLLLPLLVYTLLVISYLLLVTAAALFFRKRNSKSLRDLRFAIVIPAHNEEGLLDVLLESASQQRYPKENFEVFVIADNCSDATAQRARAWKATVLERSNRKLRGKGYALHWFFTEHRALYEKYDVVLISDADSRLSPNTLQELANSFSCEDVQALQLRYIALNPEQSWITGVTQLALYLSNHVRPCGTRVLGGTAGLKGNGMALRSELLADGWPCFSLVEDLEFSIHLLEKGILVDYNPDVSIAAEMPTRVRQTIQQRQRWEGDRWLLLKTHLPKLFRGLLTARPLAHLHLICQLLTPPTTLLLASLSLLAAGSWLFDLPTWFADGVFLGWLGFVAMVIAGLLIARTPLKTWAALAMAPLFVLVKLVLYVKMLMTKEHIGWQRTERNHEG